MAGCVGAILDLPVVIECHPMNTHDNNLASYHSTFQLVKLQRLPIIPWFHNFGLSCPTYHASYFALYNLGSVNFALTF